MKACKHNKNGRMRLLPLICACLVLFSVMVPGTASAAEPKTVRVGYMLHENYQEGGPGEVKSGYGYEYLQMLRNYTGWEYEYVYASSWAEQIAMLERGEIDLMLHAFRTPERLKTMLFSVEPMGRESNYLYTRGDHPDLVAGDLNSINGKIIGCMAGDFRYDMFVQWCEDNSITCDIESYSDLTAMHDDLSKGTIDAVIGSDFTSSPFSGNWVTILRLNEEAIYIAVSLGREDLLAEVNAAQSQILTINPYYPDEVRRKYQNTNTTHIPALTQAQKEELEARGALTVGYCAEHRPLAFTDRDTGKLQGVLADYLKAMTETYGIGFEVLSFENDVALLEALKNGTVDIVAPVGYGYGMAENSGVAITNPMTDEAMLALFKPYEGTEIKNIFKRIAVVKGSITEKDYAKHYYPDAELVEAHSVEEAVKLVNTGRADCYIISSSSWAWYAAEYPDVRDLRIVNLPNSNSVNMAVLTENIALIPILNMGINLLTEADVNHAIIAYTDIRKEVTWLTLMAEDPLLTAVVAVSIVLLVGLMFVVYRLYTEKKHLKQLRKANEKTELARQEAEEARQEAERANLAKSTFLTSMSHDIRTPMNAIVGMTTLAAKHLNNPDYVRNCLSKVNLASDHLLTLINDVLDINKIESGNLTLTPNVFSLADSIMNLANIGRHQLREKNHNFEIRIHNIKQEHLFADELRINQVFINLLSNAVKYTPAGGRITIDVKQEAVPGEPNKVRLIYEIEDTGIGMNDEFQQHMYELFAMANKSARTVAGSGVGLSICKQLIDLMGGTIVCESQEGKGTKFTVVLDLQIADKVVDHLMLPPMKILLVDDDEVFLDTAADTLKDLGVSPDCVNSGEKAILAVKQKREDNKDYPLIIIDWLMPDMDGIETTRRIRSLVGPEVSIIVISAYAPEDIRDQALAAGANGFIHKPFFRSNAYESISEVMGLQVGREEAVPASHLMVKGMRLLIAEDNDLNWEIIRELLAMYGVESHRAEHGQRCLDMLVRSQAGTYDGVLMDIQMPILNGYDTAVAIRAMQREDLRNMPIIAMTADAYTEDVLRCAQAGMNGHIPKPIDMARLLDALSALRGGSV